MSAVQTATLQQPALDWELDFYSRPILDADGRKRWELLICSSPDPLQTHQPAGGEGAPVFRWQQACPADSVNSVWLRQAIEAALAEAGAQGWQLPRRLRCWRGSMRTMVQRAAEGLGLELVPSRRCYALIEWLQERHRSVYPEEPGYMAGPLAPAPQPLRAVSVPLPEALRGDAWDWATLPAAALADAGDWEIGFAGLLPMPTALAPDIPVPGIRLFSRSRSLAIAGWLTGLEPVRLEVEGNQLILEAGLEERWLLATLAPPEAEQARAAFATAREQGCGLQFIAVMDHRDAERLEGFWLLRDLPDG